MGLISDGLFLTLIVLFVQNKGITCKSCLLSIPTLQPVEECPKTNLEWTKQSARKRCDMLKKTDNCTSFVYHCLLNQWGNATIEVCAPTWYMSGFCAMVNTDEARVIDNFNKDCTMFNEMERCPSRYISTDAYKYQVCYKKSGSPYKNKTNLAFLQHADSSDLSTIFIILFAVTFIITIILAVLLFLVGRGRLYKYSQLGKNRRLRELSLDKTAPQDGVKAKSSSTENSSSIEENTQHNEHEETRRDETSPLLLPDDKSKVTSDSTPVRGSTYEKQVSERYNEVGNAAKEGIVSGMKARIKEEEVKKSKVNKEPYKKEKEDHNARADNSTNFSDHEPEDELNSRNQGTDKNKLEEDAVFKVGNIRKKDDMDLQTVSPLNNEEKGEKTVENNTEDISGNTNLRNTETQSGVNLTEDPKPPNETQQSPADEKHKSNVHFEDETSRVREQEKSDETQQSPADEKHKSNVHFEDETSRVREQEKSDSKGNLPERDGGGSGEGIVAKRLNQFDKEKNNKT